MRIAEHFFRFLAPDICLSCGNEEILSVLGAGKQPYLRPIPAAISAMH
jgi:hypothetical protein